MGNKALRWLVVMVAASYVWFGSVAANADIIFVQVSGNSGQGTIDGVSFSGSSWTLEYGVEDSVPNTGTDSRHFLVRSEKDELKLTERYSSLEAIR